jgi:two-component system sensor histidine kinase and response regulator WspE
VDARADTVGRTLRVTADHLNRLLGLSSESLVESRWLTPYTESLQRLKRLQGEAGATVDRLQQALSAATLDPQAQAALSDAGRLVAQCQQLLAERLTELDRFDRRSVNLAQRLYDTALAMRMRPFADGLTGMARMVRDLGRALGKQVRLEVIGENTQVDRDILEKLDAPLGHLLRNAVDHGIEPPEARLAAGKPAEGVVTLEARHSAGMLLIDIADDGSGIDLPRLRQVIVQRNLSSADTAERLSDGELLEFLLLPGFSMRDTVTDVSGRGVGLDVVHTMIKQVRGMVRVHQEPGRGTRFQLQLPLTLSVVRSLLVEVGGEAYAFPLAYVNRTIELQREQIQLLEGQQHFAFDGRQIGLVAAQQILHGGGATLAGDSVPVVIVGSGESTYGLAVDRFLGERTLVVQPLDERLGKVKDIAAGALMEDGAPVLILDVEDMIRSVDKLIATGHLDRVERGTGGTAAARRKRVLVVEDSLTVRELERKLLDHEGYDVAVAVDGMDGWNALRTDTYDLLITDIDMPRMDGIELVTLVRRDPNLKTLPVMVVSYKDREEDRQRGLDAGADYYLAKASFHDETLLQAVRDLIGGATT